MIAIVAQTGDGWSRNTFTVLGITVVVVSLVVQLVMCRRRQKAMKQLAARRDMQWLGKSLPTGFPDHVLDGLGSGWSSGVSDCFNVIAGTDGKDVLLAFDITIGQGRYSYRQTVVAVRSDGMRSAPVNRGGYIYREKDNWRVVIRKHTWASSDILKPDAIEALWEALR